MSDFKDILAKAAQYCAVQERCKSEVFKKMYSWKIDKELAEKVIAELEHQGFLNEKRFAEAYARGKFNQLGWGKIKIRTYLTQLGISKTLIGGAMLEISDTAYKQTLQKLADKHVASSKSKNDFEIKVNAYRFLVSRGFEQDLVKKALDLD